MATNILGRAVSTAHLAIEGEGSKIALCNERKKFKSEFQIWFLFVSRSETGGARELPGGFDLSAGRGREVEGPTGGQTQPNCKNVVMQVFSTLIDFFLSNFFAGFLERVCMC